METDQRVTLTLEGSTKDAFKVWWDMYFKELIVVMDCKPTPKAQKWIEACVSEKKCVCGCGRTEGKSPFKRGLAYQCYYAYRTARNGLGNEKERVAYDAKLIRSGRLLLNQSCRKLKKKTVFSKAAAEVG